MHPNWFYSHCNFYLSEWKWFVIFTVIHLNKTQLMCKTLNTNLCLDLPSEFNQKSMCFLKCMWRVFLGGVHVIRDSESADRISGQPGFKIKAQTSLIFGNRISILSILNGPLPGSMAICSSISVGPPLARYTPPRSHPTPCVSCHLINALFWNN